MPQSAAPRSAALHLWSWALYLASSWTWCIGMFMPVLMVRDFGYWGWVVFAVPNVIGAAAVGFFTYGERQGPSRLEQHRTAMAVFSIVTIAFHVFFAAWLIRMLIGRWGLVLPFAATALFYGFFPRRHGDLRACGAAMLISLVAAVICFTHAADMVAPPLGWTIDAARARDLAYLAPGIVFSFLLCPHLDLTLQRARLAQDPAPGNAPRVFVLGFCVLFLLAILFTLYYAGFMARVLAGDPVALAAKTILVAIGIHMSVQSALTAALHLRELPIYRTAKKRPLEMAAAFVATAGAIWWLNRPVLPIWFGRDAGEVIYRAFLGFYGLVFPAYIWIAMIWRPSDSERPDRAMWVAVAVVILLALPFLAIGFLGTRPVWTLPGLALVFVSPLVVRWFIDTLAPKTRAVAKPVARR